MSHTGYGVSYGSLYGDNTTTPTIPAPQGTPKGPFLYKYGSEQGRAPGFTKFQASDGTYAYALGGNLQEIFDFAVGNYVDVYQDINMTGLNLLRFDLKVLQPLAMPAERDISANATLKRGQVALDEPATLESGNYEPFNLSDGDTLLVDIDGGGPQVVTFNTADFNNIFQATAEEVAAVIDTQLSPGVGTVNIGGTRIRIKSETTGTSSTVEVTGGTGAAALNFPAGVKTGGDDISAIVAPNANFSTSDVGQTIVISGTSGGLNDVTTKIMAIINSTTAMLFDQITDESTGFSAVIQGAVWKASIAINGDFIQTFTFERGVELATSDVAINVSKLTGNKRLTFRLELIAST